MKTKLIMTSLIAAMAIGAGVALAGDRGGSQELSAQEQYVDMEGVRYRDDSHRFAPGQLESLYDTEERGADEVARFSHLSNDDVSRHSEGNRYRDQYRNEDYRRYAGDGYQNRWEEGYRYGSRDSDD